MPLYYSDLTGQRPTAAEVDAILARFDRRPTFLMLAQINALLSFREKEEEPATRVQGMLFKELADTELFRLAQKKFGRTKMFERPLFHRQQLLALMRRLLVIAPDGGELNPNSPTAKEARHALGRAAAMMNDLTSTDEQAAKLSTEGATGDSERIHDELFAQLLPSFELTNPPDAPRAFVRNDEYFKIFERNVDVYPFSGGRTLFDVFGKLTALDLRRYLMLLYCIYAYYETEANDLDSFINDPSKLNVSKDTTFSKLDVSREEVDAIFALTAADMEELSEGAREAAASSTLRQFYGFAEFRRRPMVYTTDEKRLATVIDMGFLVEKVSTGVYHTILSSLEGGGKELEHDRLNFLRRYWGDVFETYVNDRLNDAAPRLRGALYLSPLYELPKHKKDRQAFDAAIDYGRAVVLMEHKGKYLRMEAKYAEDRDALVEDLNKRFGHGVRQLAENIETVFDEDVSQRGQFTERGSHGEAVRRFAPDDSKRIKAVYPVIIVQDFSLRLGFANRWLRNLFDAEIGKRKVDQGLVRPLSLLTVEDLEKILPYLDALPLDEILDEYTQQHEPLYSFEHIFNALRARKGIQRREDKYFLTKLADLHEEIKAMFVNLD
jgi:hypothetical protein